ncbi:MAG TPA: DUF2326 domain-containing protein [Candidatus Acetatifactor stercoripullorum]|uniref:DUF2326 domain-containing protein n=1 Tax=Candidatus Acetatifactor stercoripullorum TaxID=2838414 RepID=A0A9D1R387_9FIRM|nr:DUF2326 domain-containing protein [uncultured Acetatifactor sp.]HIW80170.1 DUF2326 domain-containing protein [Candidatus Acetatifactor stercoripullorum]
MLLEIRCDEFKDEGKVRDPIIFHPGLNTIMGASRASNSIGKTTFLLVIDFAFGGRDYVMLNNDVTKNVGEHSIEFAFQFGDDIYHFSRSTNDLNYVYECDENFQRKPNSRMYIDTYCEFLAKQYQMDNLTATFRELVSGYFRIYGRNNYDERHPLRAHGNDTMEAGIRRLLQLYGKYGAIGDLAALYEAALEKETTHKNALKHQYIRGVTNALDYEANKKKIAELQERKEKLASDSAEGLLDMDSVQASRLSEIKKMLAGLRRQRGKLRSQIRAMESDMEMDESSFKRDYGELREFFPEADIRHIEEIDAFHRQLKSVLKSQYRDNQKKLNDALELLDMQITVLEREVSEISDEPHLTKAVLDDYASLDREMKNLRDANEYYESHKVLHQTTADLQARLDKLVNETTAELQTDINIALRDLNKKVCEPGISAPRLTINGAKTYTYSIKNDTGTGSQTRGMLLFDLLSLENTNLPAVIEDSMSLKQVEDQVILNIFGLFNESKKQVFVTIDKGESYSEDQTIPEILKRTTVLELSAGHELYGRPWNKENSKEDKK